MLLQLLGDLGFDFVEFGQLGVANVIDADDVPAKLALDWGVGHLAFGELGHGAAELGHETSRVSPIKVTTVGAGAGVLGVFLGQVFKLGTALDLSNQGFGLVFGFHQDVAGAVFGAGVFLDELVVFGFDFSVGHSAFCLHIGQQRADQDALTGQFELVFVRFGGVQAALFGFLHEDFTGNELFLDLGHDLGRDGLAGLLHLLFQRVGTRGGNGFAIHDGDVLCQNGQGQQRCQGGTDDVLFHEILKERKIRSRPIRWPRHAVRHR